MCTKCTSPDSTNLLTCDGCHKTVHASCATPPVLSLTAPLPPFPSSEGKARGEEEAGESPIVWFCEECVKCRKCGIGGKGGKGKGGKAKGKGKDIEWRWSTVGRVNRVDGLWKDVEKYVEKVRVARPRVPLTIGRDLEERRRKGLRDVCKKPLCGGCAGGEDDGQYCPVCWVPYSDSDFDVEV